MNDYIAKRAVAAGEYLLLAKATVRQTAKKFGVSKSTVHKDVSERLVEIDPALAAKVRKILEKIKAKDIYVVGLQQERNISVREV